VRGHRGLVVVVVVVVVGTLTLFASIWPLGERVAKESTAANSSQQPTTANNPLARHPSPLRPLAHVVHTRCLQACPGP
jgi:hypothetical protein